MLIIYVHATIRIVLLLQYLVSIEEAGNESRKEDKAEFSVRIHLHHPRSSTILE